LEDVGAPHSSSLLEMTMTFGRNARCGMRCFIFSTTMFGTPYIAISWAESGTLCLDKQLWLHSACGGRTTKALAAWTWPATHAFLDGQLALANVQTLQKRLDSVMVGKVGKVIVIYGIIVGIRHAISTSSLPASTCNGLAPVGQTSIILESLPTHTRSGCDPPETQRWLA